MKFFILLFISSLSVTATVDSKMYIAKWQIEGGSIIEIVKEKDLFYGKINRRAISPRSNLNGLDNKNPDEKLRKRQLIGMTILDNLEFKNGELSGGTIYNADSGKTYTVKVWIDPEDINTCYIRAYKGFLFKTFKATRYTDQSITHN